MPLNPDAESYKLRFGPYQAPKVQIGEEIQCEVRGLVTVADWSDRGEIMWPRCKTARKRALVLTGDLIRACSTETQLAVAKYWHVSLLTVQKWKRAIGAPARTPGTEAVLSMKAHAQRSGQPVPPQTRAALLRAARRPKPEDWKRQAAEWLAKAEKPGLKPMLRRRYVEGGTPHQCPICGRFVTHIETHKCLRGGRVVYGELHVPGVATPFRLCQYCLDFKLPDQFFGPAATCRKCRSIRQHLDKPSKV